MRRQFIVELAAAFLIPLVPATLLYLLFDSQNEAEFTDAAGIVLGGPAALYFILLVLALRYFRYAQRNDQTAFENRLVGTWDVASVSSGNDRHARSTAVFQRKEGELVLAGGAFVEEDVTVGRWTPDDLILKPSRAELIFLYGLQDAKKSQSWRGIMELTLSDDGRSMTGTWEVVGPNHHSGTVKFDKRDGSA